MKNKLAFFLILPAMFLASCGTNQVDNTGTKDSVNSTTETTEHNDNTSSDTSSNGKDSSTDLDGVLKMPTNLKITITHVASTKPYEMYKVGDVYEFVHSNYYGYAVKTNNGYVSYLGEKDGSSIEWDSDSYTYPSLFKMLNNNDFGEVAELGDPLGYCNQYCEEKSETKVVAGINTTLFGDDHFSFYIDKTTNLCLEYHIGSQVTVVATEYTTSNVTLPFAAPTF